LNANYQTGSLRVGGKKAQSPLLAAWQRRRQRRRRKKKNRRRRRKRRVDSKERQIKYS
jgi:hypothetical protein